MMHADFDLLSVVTSLKLAPTRIRVPESAELTDLRHVCLRIGLLTPKRCIGVALIRLHFTLRSPTRLYTRARLPV